MFETKRNGSQLQKRSMEEYAANTWKAEPLTIKIIRLGFYWPDTLCDAKSYVKRSDRYKRHAPIVRHSLEKLTSINSSLLIAMWGMENTWTFPYDECLKEVLVVKIDYFTKWIEAMPLAR